MYEEWVARGVGLLDEKRPGWERKLDLDSLRTQSAYDCPVGQLYGDYEDGWGKLGLETGGWEECAWYGFTIPEADWDAAGTALQREVLFSELDATWRRVIRRKLEARSILEEAR